MPIKNIAGFQDQRPSSSQAGGHASQSGKDEGISEAESGAPWAGEEGARPDCSQAQGHAPLGGGSMKKSDQ